MRQGDDVEGEEDYEDPEEMWVQRAWLGQAKCFGAGQSGAFVLLLERGCFEVASAHPGLERSPVAGSPFLLFTGYALPKPSSPSHYHRRFDSVTGVPIEPFHLKREREEGYFDVRPRQEEGGGGI